MTFKINKMNNWLENQLSKPKLYLLKSCLSPSKDNFIINWENWKKNQNFEDLDSESFVLIPYLYKQLEHFKIEDENFHRYKGIYKKNWVNNIQNNPVFDNIFKTIIVHNIPFVISGNLISLKKYYNDDNLFKSSSFEIYVSKDDFIKTFKIFENLGFYFKKKQLNISQAFSICSIGRSIVLENQSGITIIISSEILPFSIASAVLLNETKYIQNINNISIPTFIDEIELIRIITKGLSTKKNAQVQWVLDAKQLIYLKQHTLDWNLILEIANENDLNYLLGIGLEYLDKLGIKEIPNEVIHKLKSNPSYFNFLLCNYIYKRSKISLILLYFYLYKKLKNKEKTNFFYFVKALYISQSNKNKI